eukprot:6021383-Alexandrium_andersonii.AAC.1
MSRAFLAPGRRPRARARPLVARSESNTRTALPQPPSRGGEHTSQIDAWASPGVDPAANNARA